MNTLYQQLEPVINHHHMSDNQLDIVKRHLTHEKDQIIQQLKASDDHLKLGNDRHPDDADTASQFEELRLTISGRDALLAQLASINKSLVRIANDDYGFCDTCGIEINLKRIAANPTSNSCVDCQSIAEQDKFKYG